VGGGCGVGEQRKKFKKIKKWGENYKKRIKNKYLKRKKNIFKKELNKIDKKKEKNI